MKSWFEKMYGKENSLRERLFRIMVSISIVATLITFVLNACLQLEAWYSLLFLATGFVLLSLLLYVSYKYHKMQVSAIAIAIVIVMVFFPVSFFVSGGIESGSLAWFILGLVFLFLLFDGITFYVLLTSTLIVYAATYFIAYYHQDWVVPIEKAGNVYVDSVISIFVVSILIGILIKFQIRVYEQERRVSDQQKKELEEINLSKSSFFTNMSHEIRTPINTIIGLNEMTLRENISDEIAENAINIQNASKMLLSLINDILDLSKIESGKMEIVPVTYETGTMISELINIIWVRANEKKLEFKLDIDKNIPSMLYGDEVRLRQVIINILTNAVKYTKRGSVTLSATCKKIDLNEIELRISVSDTGIGIRRESIDDLFSSFRRVDEKKNRNIEGTGLGLSISKQLIDLMGGKIEVDSIYTKGSTFTVTVNQKIIDETPVGTVDVISKKKLMQREKYQQSFEAPDARILVVDDNEMNLLVATKLLRKTRVQIDTAQSGSECLQMTQKKAYHVIFMDHKMPEMDGVETLRRLKKQENGRCVNTPVLALTANVMSGAKQIYRDYGFEGYLAKPINGVLFEATLLKYLPEELIEYSAVTEEQAADIQFVKGKQKKPIYITADCVCDIPQKYIEEYDIGIIPYYVVAGGGQFRDVEEIQSENLLDYLKTEGHAAHTHAASEEEYENFFADALEKGEHVIHLTIAQKLHGETVSTANEAMRGFHHVTVYDSGHLSSGMGIMVLAAAKMAKEHRSVEEILQKLDDLKKRVSTSFIVPTVQSLSRNGLVGNGISRLCTLLDLHPVLYMSKSTMKCKGVEQGDMREAYRKYIRHALQKRKSIDTRVVFITYAGCTVSQVDEFAAEVARYIQFEHVIYQQTSATIAGNCGIGAMGILFLNA